MGEKIRHLSVSKIEAAVLCPRAFKFSYVDKLPEPSSGYMLAGRVVHGLIEVAMKQVIAGGPLMSAKDLDDLYPGRWEQEVQEEEEKERFIGWKYDEDDPEEGVKDGSRRALRMAREEILPILRP